MAYGADQGSHTEVISNTDRGYSTWMGDHQERLTASCLRPSVDVDLKL
jgi:hypothetical protein